MKDRGAGLKIYQVKTNNGRPDLFACYQSSKDSIPGPSLGDIRLRLSEEELTQGNLTGTVSILTEGLAIERSQYATFRSILALFLTDILSERILSGTSAHSVVPSLLPSGTG